MSERELPRDLDAERSLLGAIIADRRAMDTVADLVAPEVFFREAHRWIFDAMLALYRAGKGIDFTLLKAELTRVKRLEDVGGMAYVAGLADGMPRTANVEHYAAILRDKRAARDIIGVAERLIGAAYDGEMEPAALVNMAEQGLLEVSGHAVPGDLASSEDVAKRVWTVVEAIIEQKRPVTGLATGFPELDRYTRGLQPGSLVILGGRPSQGKSSLAAQIALHVAQEQHVAFFSVEMSEQEQAFRILATLGQIDGHRLQCGQLGQRDYGRLTHAFTEMQALKLWIDETGGLTPLQVRSRARRLKARAGLGLIVVDYLQLLDHGRSESREQAVSQTARLLKRIAKELKVPVLALAQLSRQADQRADPRPRLSDLRESGSLEQDADLVLLIYRPPTQDAMGPPPAEVIIAKSRNGPTTTIPMRWLGEQYRFEEVPS